MDNYSEWYKEFETILHDDYGIDAPPSDCKDATELYDEGYSPNEAATIIDIEYTDSDDDEEPSYY